MYSLFLLFYNNHNWVIVYYRLEETLQDFISAEKGNPVLMQIFEVSSGPQAYNLFDKPYTCVRGSL